MTISESTEPTQTNLFDLSVSGLKTWLADMGEPAFRGTQLIKWLHQRRVLDFSEMSNLSLSFREKLSSLATLELPVFEHETVSTDQTRKWLCRLDDGNCVETVFIPERTRGTLCISSQVGCGLNCTFCATGKAGYNRHLSPSEIIGQLWLANERLSELDLPLVTNVVMMGMGEPMLNFEPVAGALELMLSDHAYGLSKYRVTVSTSGLIPQIEKLKSRSAAALAVSLHAPTDELRNVLVPINKKYPLAALVACMRDYYSASPSRFVTIEYVMLAGINDTPAMAKKLITLLNDVRCKINLIPFNSFPGTEYTCSSTEVMQAFSDRLRGAGYVSTIRKTRGSDTESACGMLVGKFSDRTSRRARLERDQKLKKIAVSREDSSEQ